METVTYKDEKLACNRSTPHAGGNTPHTGGNALHAGGNALHTGGNSLHAGGSAGVTLRATTRAESISNIQGKQLLCKLCES